MKKAREFIADIIKANPDSNDYFIDYESNCCFLHVNEDAEECEVFDKTFLDVKYSGYFVIVAIDGVDVLFYR